MSFVGFSCSSFVVVIAVLVMVLNGVEVCYGGKTSQFLRKVEKTVDMPLDSDVFAVPPGFNAPQQVFFALKFPLSSFSIILSSYSV